MNVKKIFFRDKQEQAVDVYEGWEVRWYSRHGAYSGDIKPEVKIFPNEEHAQDFKKALEAAFNLIKHTSQSTVRLIKQE